MSEVVSKSRPSIHQYLIQYFADKKRGSVLDVPTITLDKRVILGSNTLILIVEKL